MNITELPGITSHKYHVIQDSWVKQDNKQNDSSKLTENLINDKLAGVIMTETDYNEQFELQSVVLTASNIIAHVCLSYPLPPGPYWREVEGMVHVG